MIESLAGRLAVKHRTFEAGSLDIEAQAVPMFRDVGDHSTADVMEAIEADEIPHVRFANEWINRMTDADPRAVMQIAAAVSWLRKVVNATGGESPHAIATDAESRRLAGFTTAEIAEVERMERQGVGLSTAAGERQGDG